MPPIDTTMIPPIHPTATTIHTELYRPSPPAKRKGKYVSKYGTFQCMALLLIAAIFTMTNTIVIVQRQQLVLPSETIAKATTNKRDLFQSRQPLLTLRFDWTKLERRSVLAQQIAEMQSDCSVKDHGYFWHRNTAGLGSDIHLHSIALCNALEMRLHGNRKVRVRTLAPWTFRSEQDCSNSNDLVARSAMKCYFPQSELLCPDDSATINDYSAMYNMTRGGGGITENCTNILQAAGSTSSWRAATTEFLFTGLSPIVQNEAQRQLNLIFGDRTSVPKHLITVHVRWGDKVIREMHAQPILAYISAIEDILLKRRVSNDHEYAIHAIVEANTNVTRDATSDVQESVDIFLCTEDPEALNQFKKAAPPHWNVYVDQYFTEILPYRQKDGVVYDGNTKIARDLEGKSGLLALGSLLVAMEANDFVLTSRSNWSRLINELRKNVLNPRCNDCTTLIDLQKALDK
jgi:hypothetical protein